MVTRITLAVSRLCLLLTLASPQPAQRNVPPDSNSSRTTAAAPHLGLMDFALGRINPSNRDYGRCLDEVRTISLEQTIDRGYFWSNLVSLMMIAIFLCVIINQHNLQKRRDSIAAEWLTQYHNALVRANSQIEEATSRNQALMTALSTALETGVTGESTPGSTAKASLAAPRRRAYSSEQGRSALAPAAPVVGEGGISSNKVTTKAVEVLEQNVPISQDLVAKLNALQQQVNIYKEREKQLLRQVNDAELSLQKEQQKNRNLKGA
jgi:hypothetical protein